MYAWTLHEDHDSSLLLLLLDGAPQISKGVASKQELVRVPTAVAVGIDLGRLCLLRRSRAHRAPRCLSAVWGRRHHAGVVSAREAHVLNAMCQ